MQFIVVLPCTRPVNGPEPAEAVQDRAEHCGCDLPFQRVGCDWADYDAETCFTGIVVVAGEVKKRAEYEVREEELEEEGEQSHCCYLVRGRLQQDKCDGDAMLTLRTRR